MNAAPAARADRTAALAQRRALLARWAVPIAALTVALVITIRTHSFFMYPYVTPVSNDEGYLAGMALRMVRGHWLPYVDGVSQRGPILYWLTTAVMRIGGLWSWLPMRIEALALAIGTMVLVFALTTTLFSPLAGGIATMVLCYFVNYELQPWDGIGVNGEPVAVMFSLAAALIAARLQLRNPTHRPRWLFWTGFLIACAGLSKQMFLVHGVPIGLWILLGRRDDTTAAPLRERVRELGWIVAGFAVPYVIVVGIYAASGHLGTFVYYYQKYGRDIFMDPLTKDYIRDKIREQIDRYYIGIAGLGAIWFYALARATTNSAAAQLSTPDARDGGSPLRFQPEWHVVLNLVVPGAGMMTMRPRRAQRYGLALLFAPIVVLGVRGYLRHVYQVPYTTLGMVRDGLIWSGAGVLSGALCVLYILRADKDQRWNVLERVRRTPTDWFAVSQMACAFAGACFTFRFFPHYFVEFFPFAGIVAGAVIAPGFEKLDLEHRATQWGAAVLVFGGAVLLFISNSALARNVHLRRETDRWYQDPMADPIVRYVMERTTPDQTIFVWGFRAETYLSARRWPASRYVYTVYPAGVVPWFQATHEEEERRVVPGSREQLLEDLDQEQPELVVDAGRSMNGRYMYNYPMLRTYLDRKYCFMRYVDGEPVYRRRHGERCPPADY